MAININPNPKSVQGRIELKYLASNFKRMYPTIFKLPYSPLKYSFSYTTTNRTEESFRIFIDEIFGHNMFYLLVGIIPNEKLLRPFNNCKAYHNNTFFTNTNNQSELNKFEGGAEFQKMLKEISIRLGFVTKTLSPDSAWAMWTACIFDQATNSSYSPWCAVSHMTEGPAAHNK